MDSQAIEAAAARWIVRRQDDGWSAADESSLNRWLEESVAHRVAYLRLNTVWQDMERLKALAAGVRKGTIPPPRDGTPYRKPSLIEHLRDRGDIKWSRIAAVAVVVFATITGVTWYSSMARATDYATLVGQVKTIELADGSQVILNTESHISVSMRRRQINLIAGEVYFKVAKNRARPLVIAVGERQVTDVGTEFSVRREGGEIRVLVTEGRVAVASINGGAVGDPTFVDAGTLAETMKSRIVCRRASDTEREQLLSWQSGFVFFRDTVLSDAVTELNRYRRQKMVIVDPSIASIRIGGRFRSTNADAFLALLQERFPVLVEQHETSIVLKRRP
jgi:transmembrane sensor